MSTAARPALSAGIAVAAPSAAPTVRADVVELAGMIKDLLAAG